MKEGTIIGFRILIDSDGLLVTEHTELPEKDLSKVFTQEENQLLIRTAIRAFKEITDSIHERIETEIDAVNRVCR